MLLNHYTPDFLGSAIFWHFRKWHVEYIQICKPIIRAEMADISRPLIPRAGGTHGTLGDSGHFWAMALWGLKAPPSGIFLHDFSNFASLGSFGQHVSSLRTMNFWQFFGFLTNLVISTRPAKPQNGENTHFSELLSCLTFDLSPEVKYCAYELNSRRQNWALSAAYSCAIGWMAVANTSQMSHLDVREHPLNLKTGISGCKG